MSDETRDVALYCSKLQFGDLPDQVVEKAIDHLLDSVGVAIAGRPMESSQIVAGLVRSMSGTEESTVIGEGIKVPMANAAFANGAMVHAIELDDTHRWTYLHVGPFVVPAALAVAEKLQLNGKELITAIAAGYEVSVRLAYAVNPSHRLRGFHTTGTVGAVGAAATAARAMSLDPDKTANALGIGGTQAAGLFEFLAQGSMTKRFHPGRSAQSGVYAALLAQAGFTGPTTILEGEHGFCRTLSDEPNIARLNEGLGSEFKIMEMGIKPYASCRFCHASIDAAYAIYAQSGPLTSDQIEEVVDNVSPLCASQTGDTEPYTFMGAQMSTPYSIALVLAGKGAGFVAYKAGLEDPNVKEITRRIRMVPQPAYGQVSRYVELLVRLVDGRSFSATVELPTGEPENPIKRDALRQKFMGLATTAIPEQRAERIADLLEGAAGLDNLDELMALLRVP